MEMGDQAGMRPPPPPPLNRFRLRVKIFPPSAIYDPSVPPRHVMTLARGQNLALPDLTMHELCNEILRRFKISYPTEPLFKIHKSQDEDGSDLFFEDRVGDLFADNEVFRIVQGSYMRDSVQPALLAAFEYTPSQKSDGVVQASSPLNEIRPLDSATRGTISPPGRKRKLSNLHPDTPVTSRERDLPSPEEPESKSHLQQDISIPETQPTEEVCETENEGEDVQESYIPNKDDREGSPILGSDSTAENATKRDELPRKRSTPLEKLLEHAHSSAWGDSNPSVSRSGDSSPASNKNFRDSALPSSNGDIHEQDTPRSLRSSNRLIEAILPAAITATSHSKKLRRPATRERVTKTQPLSQIYNIESDSDTWEPQTKKQKISSLKTPTSGPVHPSKRFTPVPKSPYQRQAEINTNQMPEADEFYEPNMTQVLREHLQEEHEKEIRSQEERHELDAESDENERAERIMAQIAVIHENEKAQKLAGEAALRRQEAEKVAAAKAEEKLQETARREEEAATAAEIKVSDELNVAIQRRHEEELVKSRAAEIPRQKKADRQVLEKDFSKKSNAVVKADAKKEAAAQKARESAEQHAKKEAERHDLEAAARKVHEQKGIQSETPILPPRTISSMSKSTLGTETRISTSAILPPQKRVPLTPSLHKPSKAMSATGALETPVPAPKSILRTPSVDKWSTPMPHLTPKPPSTPAATLSSTPRSSSQDSRGSLKQTTLVAPARESATASKRYSSIASENKGPTLKNVSQETPGHEDGKANDPVEITSDESSEYDSSDLEVVDGPILPPVPIVNPPIFKVRKPSGEPSVTVGVPNLNQSQVSTRSSNTSSPAASQESPRSQSALRVGIASNISSSGSATPRPNRTVPATKPRSSVNGTDTDTETQAQIDSQLISSSQTRCPRPPPTNSSQTGGKTLTSMLRNMRQNQVRALQKSQQLSVEKVRREQEKEDDASPTASSSEDSSSSDDSDSDDDRNTLPLHVNKGLQAATSSQDMNEARRELSDDIANLGSSPASMDFPFQIESSNAKKKGKGKTNWGSLKSTFSMSKSKGKKPGFPSRPSSSMRGL